jgi:hypothetical protein
MQDEEFRELFHRVELRLERIEGRIDGAEKRLNTRIDEEGKRLDAKFDGLGKRLDDKINGGVRWRRSGSSSPWRGRRRVSRA